MPPRRTVRSNTTLGLSATAIPSLPPLVIDSGSNVSSTTPSTAKKVAAKNAYTDEEEQILVKICDWAKCFRWMHEQAYNVYWWIHVSFMVPVIILSTVAGTGNFALSKFEGEAAAIMPMVIGVLSLTAGTMSTILQFLKVVENLEGYRQAFLSWGQMARNIEYELAKAPSKRAPSLEFMEKVATDYNRLAEISPVIPDRVKRWFSEFMLAAGDPELMLPDICGGLRHTRRYGDDQLFNVSPNGDSTMIPMTEIDEAALLREKEEQEMREATRNTFFALHGRYPSPEEMQNQV